MKLAAPIVLIEKSIYHNCHEAGMSWNNHYQKNIRRKGLTGKTAFHQQQQFHEHSNYTRKYIKPIDPHVFGDVIITAAAIFTVIYQPGQVSQGLLTAKAG